MATRRQRWIKMLEREGFKVDSCFGCGAWSWDVEVARKGDFEIPLTICVGTKYGSYANFHILNNIKATKENLEILINFYQQKYGMDGDLVELVVKNGNLCVNIHNIVDEWDECKDPDFYLDQYTK